MLQFSTLGLLDSEFGISLLDNCVVRWVDSPVEVFSATVLFWEEYCVACRVLNHQ